MQITNQLGEDTTVHWHGAHVPPSVDGGPQNVIVAGAAYTPEFTINQGACTLWYHPHALATTARQIGMGLAGMLIVDDASHGADALPKTYGVDDFPLIVQSVPVKSATGTIVYANGPAATANTTTLLLANGTNVATSTPTLNVDVNRVRLRLLNGSLQDIIEVSRTDGGAFTQVASEAALLSSPISVTSVRMVPAVRAEIVLDLTGPVTLQATVTPGGGPGAATGPTPVVTVTTSDTRARGPLPGTLTRFTRLDTAGAATRTIALSNVGAGGMQINGVQGTSMAAMQSNEIMTTLGATEVWTVTNATGLRHSFHLHDVPFQVLSVNGVAPTGAMAEWRDTIEMAPNTTAVIAMRFTDYADDTYAYMLHCHNAIHEDEGMMTMLMVMPV
jgi:suppressor of ftsI/bilirubin oxidase